MNRHLWLKFLIALVVIGICGLAYFAWSPGLSIRDGRHDLRTNGIWIQHGWLGDDSWFQRNQRDKSLFRDTQKIQELARLLDNHGVKYIFPHLCPSSINGNIAPSDPTQIELFLDSFNGFSVIPWIGGILNTHCFLESGEWRTTFVSSIVELLQMHPRLAGVHINIEPMSTGNQDFLTLLAEIHSAMPRGKILSVAAYPPITFLHPFHNVHWKEAYFRDVAQNCDQMAVMMYDTALRSSKLYQHLMSVWTTKVLNWSDGTQVLLGIPAYDDAGAGYHSSKVENLENSIIGINASLIRFEQLPANYSGIAIYCEWEMDEGEWKLLKTEFGNKWGNVPP